MVLYKFKDYEYTTNDLFFNRPCEVMGVVLYPVKAKDYEQFLNYAKYVIFSAKHLGIDKIKDVDLLNSLIILSSSPKGELDEGCLLTTLIDLCNLFSLVTKKEIEYYFNENGYFFKDKEGSIVIDKKNFNRIRTTILRMGLLKEPKIFEREIDRKWDEKVRKAHSKNTPTLEFGEIVLVVSQDMKYSIEQTLELNIFQLNSYYMRIIHIYEAETTRLFATVSSDCKPTPFAKNIFDELYKDHSDEHVIRGNNFTKLIE